jgi:alpha-mannosidase
MGIEHIHASSRREMISSFRFVGREVPRSEVAFVARDVPAFGGRTYFLRPRRGDEVAAASSSLLVEPLAVENEYLRVEAHPAAGTLTVVDKTTGVRYSGLNRFEDGGDVGDVYTYCPPRADVVVTNPRYRPQIEVTRGGPTQATLRIAMRFELPMRCSDDRQARHYEMLECPNVTEVSLVPSVRRVDIRTVVDNQVRDHRLRVLFPTPFPADTSEAEDAFAVTRRPIRQPMPSPPEAPWEVWAESPVNTHPQKRFVDVSDGTVGLSVLNRGLPEYEVMPWPVSGGVAIALTLLRCVEWLSRADLDTRRGHAGPMEHTPAAQCLGESVFEYALVPHTGTWGAQGAMPLLEAQAFEAPLRARAAEAHAGKLAPAWSFATVAPDTVVVSAIKRAEGENALVLRLYNPTDHPTRADISLLFTFRSVRLVDLNEGELPEAENQAHSLAMSEHHGVGLQLRAGEIVSLLFRF